MAATASTSTAVHVLEPNHEPGTGSSAEAWRPLSCAGGGEENVLDLDSPWAAVAEAGSRLEEATAAGAGLRAEEEAGQDEIRDNLQRQEDEATGKMSAREMVEELMSIKELYNDARSCP
uniref:Uncharacterized protein n=1 Tax=Aegilops tauschii TaxID=37682 RepID=M8CCN1_AEGTA